MWWIRRPLNTGARFGVNVARQTLFATASGSVLSRPRFNDPTAMP